MKLQLTFKAASLSKWKCSKFGAKGEHVVPSVWAELPKETKLEASPIRMFIINFASPVSCFLPSVDLGSWFYRLRRGNTYREPTNTNPDALCISA